MRTSRLFCFLPQKRVAHAFWKRHRLLEARSPPAQCIATPRYVTSLALPPEGATRALRLPSPAHSTSFSSASKSIESDFARETPPRRAPNAHTSSFPLPPTLAPTAHPLPITCSPHLRHAAPSVSSLLHSARRHPLSLLPSPPRSFVAAITADSAVAAVVPSHPPQKL